jgi:hypothetical protein
MRHVRGPTFVAVVGISVLLGGCGRKPAPTSELSPTEISKRDVGYFGLAWINYLGTKKVSPGSMADLEPKRATLGRLPEQIKDGLFIVIWGAGLTEDGRINDLLVIGYEKKVPTDGGIVLFGGGKVKELTAEAFKREMLAKKGVRPSMRPPGDIRPGGSRP